VASSRRLSNSINFAQSNIIQQETLLELTWKIIRN